MDFEPLITTFEEVTLPETSIAPPGNGDSYWKPPFLVSILVLGSVLITDIAMLPTSRDVPPRDR